MGGQIPIIDHLEAQLSLSFIQISGLKKAAHDPFRGSDVQPLLPPQKFLSGFPDRLKRVLKTLYGSIPHDYCRIRFCEGFLESRQGFLGYIQSFSQSFHGVPTL